MLAEELYEQLKAAEPDLATIKAFWKQSGNEEEFERLSSVSQEENFWQNQQHGLILKKLQHIRTLRDNYDYATNNYHELHELIKLFESDTEELDKLHPEITNYCRAVTKLKINLLLSDEADDSNCFLSINAGAGGTESQDWSDMLLRMYVRFCERERFSVSILDYQPGEGAGIKSATLFVKGKNAYGLLKSEQGIHRLVRISPFDANKRRHTSFAAVLVLPEVETTAVTIDTKDLRIDTYRAGGAGGQHVNKTESAVRITHIPTNTVVQCQSERSQVQNKDTAMKMLMAKLKQRQREEQEAKTAAIEKKSIEWGSQIRSYVLHPYKLVKDHRTEIESQQPELVLDGDLMQFIEGYLIYASRTHRA